MSRFAEYKTLDLPEIARDIRSFWEVNRIFEKSVTYREGKPPFVFYEGPPSANGLPGIHHVMARAIKDIFCRYKTQKGFQVKRKAGWDTHGLPIELGVEKELGITKEDIGKTITVEAYNEACKKAVMRYTDVWNDLTRRMGYWVDMDNPYVTYTSKYMETVWWLLKQLYDRGLIYKGYSIQPYSPKAGTGLSSHELNQPGTYQDITDTTVTAQFRTLPRTLPQQLQGMGDVFILAWTTTPWTLPSNTALTVGENIDYVLVSTYNQYTFAPVKVILAEELVSEQFTERYVEVYNETALTSFAKGDKKIPFRILQTLRGRDLLGIRYEQLLPYALPYKNAKHAFRVIAGDFVTTEDGTGIVHTAPTFGADDAKVAAEASPPVPPMLVLDENDNPVPLVDLQGRFRPELGALGGKYVKNEYYTNTPSPERSVDVEIAIKLKEENKAFKVEKYVHSYPNCWRTDKPILYYPLDSWFVKATVFKDRMYELNKTINWKPPSTGEGRFGNWLANANDWNLSRSRFWGIPLPIWRTEDGKEEKIIGSVAELKQEMIQAIEAGFMDEDLFEAFVVGDMSDENYNLVDLHKHVVDKIVLASPSGKPMRRETDLIDVWFDSGSMPYAQWHYPFENREKIDERYAFPADYIAEGVDQTRGWFYTLHAIATSVFDSVAYKNVVSNGLVLDKNGQKMSKRLGNAVNPFETLEKYSADATRWYMISNANPWDNLKFNEEGILEVRNKFFGTLYNTYAFFSLYSNLDGFTYCEADIPFAERPEIDRWILSELHSLINTVDKAYADYEPTKAARAIAQFVQDHLSNWYVRLSRRRFWKGEYGADKLSAYQTLYSCLVQVAKLSAPIAPFYMDQLYRDLNSVTQGEDSESVHLSDFPVSNALYIDKPLERRIEKSQAISSLVLSLRKKKMIRVRQPLQKIMIPVRDESERKEIMAVSDLVLSEVNVKEIELLDDASEILVRKIRPNFRVLGPRFGKDMNLISSKIAAFTPKQIREIETKGNIELSISGKMITLDSSEVEIGSQDIEGWSVASAGSLTVALDLHITPELRREGIARELINRIQSMRKEAGLEVTDRIDVQLQRDPKVEDAVTDNLKYIKDETLIEKLAFTKEIKAGIDISFDDVHTRLTIKKHK